MLQHNKMKVLPVINQGIESTVRLLITTQIRLE